ncbi:MAG: T9SS type A sorting domain-containing protein, partial [Bacteroidota bacterium]|nr:T9SS type A sorting domain-containing protein [Bacteroidota bacterium]
PAPNPANPPFTLKVLGENIGTNTVIYINATPLTTSIISNTEARATITTFTGNPTIRLYTPPLIAGGLDGGFSNGKSFVSKPLITVTANNATKKYGENNPVFSSTVIMNGLPLPSGISLASLRLDNISYATNANLNDGVNNYYIQPLNPLALPLDQSLLNAYNYEFVNGVLSIQKMPLTITPNNKTIKYGEYAGDVTFNYQFNQANMSATQISSMLDLIKAGHKKILSDNALAVFNGFNTATPSLSEADLTNMSIMTSFQSAKNARRFMLSDGRLVPIPNTLPITRFGLERYLIDVSAQSLNNYKSTPNQLTLASAFPGGPLRGLVNSNTVAGGGVTTSANGQLLTMSNGQLLTMSNGQLLMLSNGQLLTISNNGSVTSNLVPMLNGQLLTLSNGVLEPLADGQLAVLVDGEIKSVNSVSVTTNHEVVATLTSGQLLTLSNGQLLTLSNGQLLTISNGQLLTLANSQLVTLSNGEVATLTNGQLLTLSNGQLLTLSNGQLLTLSNGGSITLSNGQLLTLSNGQLLTISNGQLLTISNGEMFTIANGGIQVVNNVSVSSAGSLSLSLANGQLLTLSNGQLLTLSNGQLLTLSNGQLLTISNGQLLTLSNGRLLTISNSTQLQTLANGQLLTISNTGSGAGIGNAKPLVIVDQADISLQRGAMGGMFSVNMITGLDVGTQKLIPGTFINSNFDITYGLGTVEITKAPVSITADVKYINQGSPLPVFTSSLVGLSYNDVISGINYSARTVNTSVAGVYNNMPSLATSTYPNYEIIFVTGKFYVNPYGPGAKKVQPKLECVEQVSNMPGFGYVAHFSYENKNSTPFYVPLGADNSIVASGPYSGTPPVAFAAGSGSFNIFFDGKKMTWTLKTNEGQQKTAMASDASSSSNRCNSKSITAASVMIETTEAMSNYETSTIYPNPVINQLTLTSALPISSDKDVLITDVNGRSIPIAGLRRISTNVVVLNVAGLQKGVYFLRLKTSDSFRTFRFIKL